jgi:hypothetical protein
MHLVLMRCHTDDPVFESTLPVDGQALDDIKAQVCAHGFGKFRVALDDEDAPFFPALIGSKFRLGKADAAAWPFIPDGTAFQWRGAQHFGRGGILSGLAL